MLYIGEMRDLETIQLAITAAETGHLVLGTLHTSSASKTVEELLMYFLQINKSKQDYKFNSLAGIMSQKLCKNTEGKDH